MLQIDMIDSTESVPGPALPLIRNMLNEVVLETEQKTEINCLCAREDGNVDAFMVYKITTVMPVKHVKTASSDKRKFAFYTLHIVSRLNRLTIHV